MINKLKYIYRQLNRSIFVGEKLQSNINALSYVGLAISFCTLITTSMNIIQGSYFMAVTTAFFCVVGIFAFITCHYFKKRTGAIHAMLFACILLMTYYCKYR